MPTIEERLMEITASQFVPQGKWLDSNVLRFLNLAVLDEDRDFIKIKEVRLEEGINVEDDEELFDIAMEVREVAEEEMGESSRLKKFWEEFQELDRFEIFKEVASANGSVTGKDLAERRGEPDKRQAISQALLDTSDGKVNPYYKEGRGEYSLSFVGEYLIQRFGDMGSGIEDGTESEESEATLDNF
jgi:hypothetical protein